MKRKLVFGMLAIGLSPFLMNLCSCMVVILINNGLKNHGGDMAIGAFGIVNRISFLFIMIIMGSTKACNLLQVIITEPVNSTGSLKYSVIRLDVPSE